MPYDVLGGNTEQVKWGLWILVLSGLYDTTKPYFLLSGNEVICLNNISPCKEFLLRGPLKMLVHLIIL